MQYPTNLEEHQQEHILSQGKEMHKQDLNEQPKETDDKLTQMNLLYTLHDNTST